MESAAKDSELFSFGSPFQIWSSVAEGLLSAGHWLQGGALVASVVVQTLAALFLVGVSFGLRQWRERRTRNQVQSNAHLIKYQNIKIINLANILFLYLYV